MQVNGLLPSHSRSGPGVAAKPPPLVSFSAPWAGAAPLSGLFSPLPRVRHVLLFSVSSFGLLLSMEANSLSVLLWMNDS